MMIPKHLILTICFNITLLASFQAQHSAASIIWDFQTNTLSGVLPQDETFILKIVNIPSEHQNQHLRVSFWDNSNEKKIEKALKKELNKNLTKTITQTPDPIQISLKHGIHLQSKLNHKSSRLFHSAPFKVNSSQTETFIISPTKLEPNRSYVLFLESHRELTTNELRQLHKHFEEVGVYTKLISDLLSVALEKSKQKDKLTGLFEEYFYENTPKYLQEQLWTYDPSYILFPFQDQKQDELWTSLKKISKYYQDFVDNHQNLVQKATYKWQEIVVPEMHSTIEVKDIPDEDTRKDLEKQLRKFHTEKSKYANLLKESINAVIDEFVISRGIVGSTFSSEFIERSDTKLTSATGLGIVGGSINKPTTTIGVQYHLRPINDRVPIAAIRDGTFLKTLLRRVSIFAAVSFVNLNNDFFDDKREGILNNQSVLGGIGIYAFDGVYVNLGGMLFNEIHPNPLISEKELRLGFFTSLAIDIRLNNKFKLSAPEK